MAKTDLTAERLREKLTYDTDTGVFVWKQAQGGVRVGRKAGCLNKHINYWYIGIDGVSYLAHRLAWLYVHGEWPPEMIDHANGDGSDNRLANLRPATRSQQQQNIPGKSKRGMPKGVKRRAGYDRYEAEIKVNGRKLFLGGFDTPELAHAAYCEAGKALFGGFFCDGSRVANSRRQGF